VAFYLIKMREFIKAITCLQKARLILGEDECILSNMAVAHAKNKNWTEASAYFEGIFAKKPMDPTTMNNLASCLMESERYQLALRCLNRAISLEESNLTLLLNKAQCLMYLKEYQEAKKVVQIAMTISPNNSIGLYILGQIHEELQEEDTALTYYNKAWGLG